MRPVAPIMRPQHQRPRMTRLFKSDHDAHGASQMLDTQPAHRDLSREPISKGRATSRFQITDKSNERPEIRSAQGLRVLLRENREIDLSLHRQPAPNSWNSTLP